jgi:hypothetical protein
MRTTAGRFDSGRPHEGGGRALWRAMAPCALLAALVIAATLAPSSPASPGSVRAPGAAKAGSVHAICSGANSAKVPCRFSTPNGNIRCIWTPKPNNVACVLRSTGRAYRLRPAGRAKAIKLTLATPSQTLPRNQQIVFPSSLSCRDTRNTMICNQDFATGAFTLAPKGSHSS